MTIVGNLLERLRPLVGLKGWDYCVFWKMSLDQRFIECLDCCCAGIDITQNGEEFHHFPFSPVIPCRDVLFQHRRTKSCELLFQLPSSIPLDSGIYAQTLISNQPRWLNFSNSSDLDVMVESTVWTRVLIPVAGGLIELFVTKEVSEDPHIIDFVTSQCSISMEKKDMINTNDNMDTQKPFLADIGTVSKDHDNNFRVCNSPVNFMQHIGHSTNATSESKRPKNDHHVFFQGSHIESSVIQKMDALTIDNATAKVHMQGNDQTDSIELENGRSDSAKDCSDQTDDDEDESIDLDAEREMRRMLYMRLYTLRELVPIISNLDKASIVVDAIAYVKQLQQQVKELQHELFNSDDDGGKKNNDHVGNNKNNVKPESLSENGRILGPKTEHDDDKSTHIFDHMGNCNVRKHNQDTENTDDKGQQMEVHVKVAQLDGNEFFVRVLCKHNPGWFVRLMKALNSLGLEVTIATVTSFRGLVSNGFNVEKRDSEMVQADHVRDLLLDLMRNPARE